MNIVARAYGTPTYTISARAINTEASTTTRRRVIGVHLTLRAILERSHEETDHRHRRTLRCRQGHRVACAGADTRLQAYRHWGDVSRGWMEGASRRHSADG